MSPKRWSRVEELFLEATDMPEAERERFLASVCGPDTALREDVLALIRYDQPSTESVDLAIQEVAAHLADDDFWIGRVIGSYRIIQELGVGGMGAVYLAERADQRFEKRVAIKLVHRAMDTEGLRGLLLQERRVLAALDHPYIAKLIDGGETEEGIPYFVLEYIEGEPIHRYAASRQLSAAAKCELMTKVCEGVAYAHRRLVVHLDLKPSNILVAADGTPKLLDFGIAGLLQAGEDEARSTGPQAFTPEYASPELAAGQPITIAADIYSLGIILREMLTGNRAANGSRLSPDLRAILEKATETDSSRRYSSTEEFAADVSRSLRRYPVSARQGAFAYRTGRFLQRNRIAVAGIALSFMALSIATAIAVSQARDAQRARGVAEIRKGEADAQRYTAEQQAVEARHARQAAEREHGIATLERDHAVQQTAIAEHRLQEFTALADNTVGDLNNLLERMPGATEGRRAIVSDTLLFLDKARAANPDNLSILTTVASGYLKMAQLLGQPYRPNLGDIPGSKANLDKAEVISSAMLKRYPSDERMQVIWLQTQGQKADFLEAEGRAKDGAQFLLPIIATAERWRLSRHDPDSLVHMEVWLRLKTSRLAAAAPGIDALQQAQLSIDLAGPALQRHPENLNLLQDLGSGYGHKQQALVHLGRRDGLLENGDKAIEIAETILRRSPEDILRMRTLSNAYQWQGSVAADVLIDHKLAKSNYQKALELFDQISMRDPDNVSAKSDLANILDNLARVKTSLGERREALTLLNRSLTYHAAITKVNSSPGALQAMANSYQLLGRCLWQEKDAEGAVANARKALDIALELVQRYPASSSYRVQVLGAYAVLLPAAGKALVRTKAETLAEDALRRAAMYTSDNRQRRFLPRLWTAQGDMFRELADSSQACHSYRKGVEAWDGLDQTAKQAAGIAAEIAEAKEKLGRCGPSIE